MTRPPERGSIGGSLESLCERRRAGEVVKGGWLVVSRFVLSHWAGGWVGGLVIELGRGSHTAASSQSPVSMGGDLIPGGGVLVTWRDHAIAAYQLEVNNIR